MNFFQLFIAFFLVTSLNVNAGEFLINNNGVDESITFEMRDYGTVQLRNFRARVIANTVHKKSTASVVAYLNKMQSNMPKAFFPPVLCDSAQTAIYNHTRPTKRLTLVVSADGYRDDQFVTKVMLYAEDFKVGDAIKEGDRIRIQLGRLNSNKFRFDMNALVDKNNGHGYNPVEVSTERYVTFFN